MLYNLDSLTIVVASTKNCSRSLISGTSIPFFKSQLLGSFLLHPSFFVSFFSVSLSSWYIFTQARIPPPANLCFKELFLCPSPISRSWSCLCSIRLQVVQCCYLYWQGILKAHVWTRKPNLIPGLPLRVEDVKPTGYVVSSRRREGSRKHVGGDRRWRNCQ